MTTSKFDILRKAEQVNFSRARAYVILPINKDDVGLIDRWRGYGKIQVAYPKDGAGRLRVFVWDIIGTGLQIASAGGYGYDKLGGALEGMKFDNITLSHNWENDLREAGYTVIQAL